MAIIDVPFDIKLLIDPGTMPRYRPKKPPLSLITSLIRATTGRSLEFKSRRSVNKADFDWTFNWLTVGNKLNQISFLYKFFNVVRQQNKKPEVGVTRKLLKRAMQRLQQYCMQVPKDGGRPVVRISINANSGLNFNLQGKNAHYWPYHWPFLLLSCPGKASSRGRYVS